MTPRAAIARIAKAIGQELERGPGPSEGAWAAGEMLAEAGATGEIATCLLAEARRKHRNDRLIHGCAFLLERALDALRLRANGGDTGAGHAIAAVREGITAALTEPGAAPEALMLLARAFAQAELDPGEALQQAALTRLLPERRGFWAERCAWMAAVLRESAEMEDEAWVDFALVARDLVGDRPLDTMPLAARIAAATVQAFQQR